MYTTFYGLRLKPFENTPDTRFLYPSESHREILASLKYGVENSKGFILIAGAVGTGKTTMIYSLLKSIDPAYIVFNIFNPKWKFAEIIKFLAIKIGVYVEKKDSIQILDDLKTRLEKLDYSGKRVVLIIDEAHLLSESALEDIRLISNIEKENKKLIQIVLVGQNEIYQTLQKDSLKTLKQRILINRELKPLTRADSRHYIRHRLNIAGANIDLFDKSALFLIWRKSGGIPRIINHICDNALLIGLAEEKQIIGAKIIKEVVKDMETGHKKSRYHLNGPHFRLRWFAVYAAIALTILIGVFLPSIQLSQIEDLKNIPDLSIISAQKEKNLQSGAKFVKKFETTFTKVTKQDSAKPSESQRSPQSPNLNGAIHPDPETTRYDIKTAGMAGTDTPVVVPTIRKVGLKPPPLTKIQNDNNTNNSELIKKTKKVMPKEYLYKIAAEEYGTVNDTVLDIIHMANPEIKNLNLIFPGQIVRLPQISRQDLIVKDSNGRFHIHYASHYKFKDAQITVQSIVRDNLEAFASPSIQGDNSVYRVYCGNYISRIEAEEEIKTLELKQLPFVN